ncbi:MAG: TatD family hydrolase [Actinomycetota bacterium]
MEAPSEPVAELGSLHSDREGGTDAGADPLAEAVDAHCHLFLMEGEPADIVAEANAAGVGRLICVGIDPGSSRRSLELAESFRGVFATAGMHPHTASEFDQQAGSAIEELVADPMVVAVGETGLDYYRGLSPVEDQQRAFRTHIALSREHDKPLVVHVREAWDDAMAILEEEGAARVVLHCFSGDEVVAAEALRRGYFISFAGNITYPGTENLRAVAKDVPAGRILAETDSPFLSPQHVRGQPNAPSNVVSVIAALAAARGDAEPAAMVAETTVAALEAFPSLL